MTKLVKLMNPLHPDFQEYEAVLEKVAVFTQPLWEKFQSEISCQKGCAQCCTAGLTLLPVEAAYVREALENHRAHLPQRAVSPSHCQFLRADLLCSIYAFRPLVCRTHGLPVKLAGDDLTKAPSTLRILGEDTFTCSLNFESGRRPPAGDVLDAEKLYRLLWVVNARFCAQRGLENPNARISVVDLVSAWVPRDDPQGG